MKNTVLNVRVRQGTGSRSPAVRVRMPSPALRQSIPSRQASKWRETVQRQAVTPGTTNALPARAAPDALPSADLSPCDVWWRLEDLWLRLTHHTTVRLEEDCGEYRLVVTGYGQATDVESSLLWTHAGDTNNYVWQLGNQTGSFAQVIYLQGSDLICQLAPSWRVESWPEGPGVWAMVRGFLAGLRVIQNQGASMRATA